MAGCWVQLEVISKSCEFEVAPEYGALVVLLLPSRLGCTERQPRVDNFHAFNVNSKYWVNLKIQFKTVGLLFVSL